MFKKILSILALVFFVQFLFGQNKSQIEGQILNYGTVVPIEYASIAVLKNDSIIDGRISNVDGRFMLDVVGGFDRIEVSFIGYQSKVILSEEIDPKEKLEIFLEENEEQLGEIVVETERTATQQLIDRRVVNVGVNLQNAGGSALEVFDQIPEIQTDLGSGEIFLRGSNNILLLVNGKPSGFSPSELLAQIPSSNIDKIEIITSPSAKHQADGISGILNILLKKNTEEGLNLKLIAGIGTKRHNLAMEGNYSHKQINFRWHYSQSKRDMDSEQWLRRTYSTGVIEEIYAPHDFDGNVNRISLGTDFLINKRNELSLSWDYVKDNHDFFNKIFYTYLTGEPSVDYLRTSAHFHNTNTWNANYRHKINEDEHFLELDYNLNINDNNFPALDFESTVFIFEEKYANQNTLQSLSLDYTLPISKQLKMETGTNWSKRKLQSQYSVMDADSLLPSNAAFNYEENILMFYSSFLWKIKDKYSLQAGLRYEYFKSHGEHSSNLQTVDYSFSDLFPSLHFNYQINEQQQLNVGLGRRISRPHFNHLNPFRIGNPYYNFVGNSELSPEYSNNVELNYSLINDKVSFAMTAFYRYRIAVIQRIDSFTEDGVQQVENINMGNKESYGIESSISKNILPFWRTTLTTNYFYTKIQNKELVYWNRLYSSTIQLKNAFNLGKVWSMDLTYRYTPKMQQAFEYVDPRNRVDFAARGRFLEKRLSLSLSIVDVFNINLFYRTTKTKTLTQYTKWRFQSQTRGFILSLNYQLVKKNTFSRDRKKRDYSHEGAVD